MSTELAIDLPFAQPERAREEAPQRRLRAVERPVPQRRPRLVYGLIAVGGALAIAAAQMALSIMTTQSTYELKDLTAQQREVTWQKQILEDELAGLSSPQYLAANAASLGMVTGQTPSYLRLSDATIVGSGKKASATSSIQALSKAAVSNALVAGTSLVTDPAASLESGAAADTDAAAAGATDGTAPAESATPPAITDGLPTPDTH